MSADAQKATTEPTVTRLSSMRRQIGRHMVSSVATSPHVSMAMEVDFGNVDSVRRVVAAPWREREGFSLTYLPFVVYALCRAIEAHPQVNAAIVGDSLHVFPDVNLGFAVDLDGKGLVVPVLREAQRASVPQIARGISMLAARARARRLTVDDFEGGTYTVSNNGRSTYFTTPIINQPQTGILSVDGVTRRPVVSATSDEIVVRPVGLLTQSFDHRSIDGAYASSFLGRVKDELEGLQWTPDDFA